MTGGSATHAGIGFQDKVAGLLSVHLLADAPADSRLLRDKLNAEHEHATHARA